MNTLLLLWLAIFVGQPIAFSHKQHAAQECAGCHKLAPSGEVLSIPTAKDCLPCHEKLKELKTYIDNKQAIPWVRIYELPSFVEFNHRAHLNAGTQCETCHGPVATRERLTLESDISMGGCLDCHRTAKAQTNCSGCHRLN